MDIRDLEGRALIVGGGIAGLMTALKLAPEPCVVLSRGPIGEDTSSILAQGGVAACIGFDDSVALQVADTLAAGDGLCDAPVVEKIVAGGPAAIEDLVRLGVPFDRDANGNLRRGLEAAHNRHRIIHAGGDKTGREITLALAAAVHAAPSVTILEGFAARRLNVEDDAVSGLVAEGAGGTVFFRTNRIVIATGGVSGLFAHGHKPRRLLGPGSCDCGARRCYIERYGIRAIPSDRARWYRTASQPHQRSGAGRGRDPHQRKWRALHGRCRGG